MTQTFFASAERATNEELRKSSGMLIGSDIVDHAVHVAPFVLMVLNKERQVIYSNQRLLDLLGIASSDEIIGMRPGEIFDCVHSHNECGGCGTSKFCSECGAVKAILKSQSTNEDVESECRITTASGKPFDLRVWTAPYHCGGMDFTVFTICDISAEKRREALEHILFHDINNILTSLSGHAKLLETSHQIEDELSYSAKVIQKASRELTNEIRYHCNLMLAEREMLEVEATPGISSLKILQDLAFLDLKKKTVIDQDSEDFELTTDRILLFRILLNMVKNAVEAIEECDAVTLGCRTEGNAGVFTVHNPGCIPQAAQLQIFNRSFTTKGKGRGIGTYSMRLFGEKYLKGKVGFTSSEQAGTTFHITVPLIHPGN
ncbi:MAG TPA: HAMP domain-containing sensor histidine kinase [Pontiella sp.]